MQFIVHRRFKDKAICGDVNIPAMTICSETDGMIYCGRLPVCFIESENAHQFFSCNDDGNGLKRGKLTQEIQKKLTKRDQSYQIRWDKVWNDPVCKKYKRTEYDDFWLWNHDFYNADIESLKHIAALIGIKEYK